MIKILTVTALVFLRVLEYYEGVLFLTTNQVGSFDEAFKSRISTALYYPPLTLDQTLRIWASQRKRVAERFPELRFNDIELEYYARELFNIQNTNDQYKPAWNGRQIRNAFQTAVSMAEFEAQDKKNILVTRSHFERVAQISNQFNLYLYRVKWSRTDAYRMQSQGLRDDTFFNDMASLTVQPQAQLPSYQTSYPNPQSQVPPNIGYSQPGLGAAANPGPGPRTGLVPYNAQPQGYPGGQSLQYNPPLAMQQQPPYGQSGYPDQGQGQGQGQGQVQGQQMAPPHNENPQIQHPTQYGAQGHY